MNYVTHNTVNCHKTLNRYYWLDSMPYECYGSFDLSWGMAPDCLISRIFGINGALPAVAL